MTSRRDAREQTRLWIGTSGWSYDHWRNLFYPEALPKKDWFAFFARHFRTVELNATFYRLFPETTFEKWASQAPEGFLYATKCWRVITHRKRLKNVRDEVNRCLARAAILGEHLGPLLVQLPPGLHRDDELLRQFLDLLNTARTALKPSLRIALEFRHASWFADETCALLTDANVALCLADMPGLDFPGVVTGDFVYVRFHGRPRRYRSSYGEKALREWRDRIRGLLNDGYDVYAYFNNDFDAHAVNDARRLAGMLAGWGFTAEACDPTAGGMLQRVRSLTSKPSEEKK